MNQNAGDNILTISCQYRMRETMRIPRNAFLKILKKRSQNKPLEHDNHSCHYQHSSYQHYYIRGIPNTIINKNPYIYRHSEFIFYPIISLRHIPYIYHTPRSYLHGISPRIVSPCRTYAHDTHIQTSRINTSINNLFLHSPIINILTFSTIDQIVQIL